MRNKSCPIVTFQPQQSRRLFADRVHFDRSSPHPISPTRNRSEFADRRSIEPPYGKPRVNRLRVGCEMRLGKTHSAPQQATFHSVGPNCGFPATGSEDYRIGSVATLEVPNPFG